jgi:hypothetical protein
MTRDLSKKIIGYAVFALLIVVHFAFGPVALVRALGVVLVAGGGYSFFQGNIPYGIEGRAPSGHIIGSIARLLSAAIVVLGIFMVATAPEAACILGWAQPGSCA